MFGFLRTSSSAQKSRLASNPDLRVYRINLSRKRNQRLSVPLLGLVTTGFLLFHISGDSFNKIITDKPRYIPIGLISKVDPKPYKSSDPEVKAYRSFLGDKHKRVKAEST
jgi:hypothetical protein